MSVRKAIEEYFDSMIIVEDDRGHIGHLPHSVLESLPADRIPLLRTIADTGFFSEDSLYRRFKDDQEIYDTAMQKIKFSLRAYSDQGYDIDAGLGRMYGYQYRAWHIMRTNPERFARFFEDNPTANMIVLRQILLGKPVTNINAEKYADGVKIETLIKAVGRIDENWLTEPCENNRAKGERTKVFKYLFSVLPKEKIQPLYNQHKENN